MPTRAPTRSPTLKSIPLRLDLGQLGLCLYRGNDASSRLGRSRSNAFTLRYVFKPPATAAIQEPPPQLPRHPVLVGMGRGQPAQRCPRRSWQRLGGMDRLSLITTLLVTASPNAK